MELEVGMYVRFKDKRGNTYIRKIIDIPKDNRYASIYIDKEANYTNHLSFKNVLKTSHNIIDLIEVGDYVNGVQVIDKEIDNLNEKYLQCGVGDYVICTYNSNEIEDVVTKEQFSAMEYKVESEVK